MLKEYHAVLLRPAIARRHGLTAREVDVVLLTEFAANARWREPASGPAAPDPGDGHPLALLGRSDVVLVAGDRIPLENPPATGSVLSVRSLLELTNS